jgi:hypothetical protein
LWTEKELLEKEGLRRKETLGVVLTIVPRGGTVAQQKKI